MLLSDIVDTDKEFFINSSRIIEEGDNNEWDAEDVFII